MSKTHVCGMYSCEERETFNDHATMSEPDTPLTIAEIDAILTGGWPWPIRLVGEPLTHEFSDTILRQLRAEIVEAAALRAAVARAMSVAIPQTDQRAFCAFCHRWAEHGHGSTCEGVRALADPTGSEAAARVQALQRTLGHLVTLVLQTSTDQDVLDIARGVTIEYVDGEPQAAL